MFSTDEVPQSTEFSILPAGIYRGKVLAVELKNNSAQNGSYFAFTISVISPHEYANQKVTHRCTYTHKTSEKAVIIGRSEMADLLYTMQIKGFGNTDELQRYCAGKEFIFETENELDDKGNEWPRIISTWSLGGKHRNPTRARDPETLPMGPSNRPLKQRRGGGGNAGGGQPQYNGGGRGGMDDVPF